MATYNVYTKSKTLNYFVGFKCECCGRYTISSNAFTIKWSYTDRDAFTINRVKQREIQAEENLNAMEAFLLDEIIAQTRKRKIKDTGYNCVCANCNAVPKWSRFRKPLLDILSRLFSVLALCLALFMVSTDSYYFSISDFLLPIGIFAEAFLPLNIWYLVKEIKVKKMKQEFMPIVCKTAEEVQKILEEAELKHEIPVQPEKKHEDAPPVVAGWTCTCGKTHPAYEYACVCGVTKAQAKAAQGKLNHDQ